MKKSFLLILFLWYLPSYAIGMSIPIQWYFQSQEKRIAISMPGRLSQSKIQPQSPIIQVVGVFSLKQIPDQGLWIHLGRIRDVDKTYVNGYFIGKTGQFPPQAKLAYDVERDYWLPATHLRQGKNELIVQIFHRKPYDRAGILAEKIFFFKANEFYAHFLYPNWIYILLVTAVFLTGIHSLVLVFFSNKRPPLFGLSAGLILLSFYLAFYLKIPYTNENHFYFWKRFEIYLAALLPIPFYLFVFWGTQTRKFIFYFLTLVSLSWFGAFCFAFPFEQLLNQLRLWQFWLIISFIVVFIGIFTDRRLRQKEFLFCSFSLIMILFGAVLDIVRKDTGIWMILPYASAISSTWIWTTVFSGINRERVYQTQKSNLLTKLSLSRFKGLKEQDCIDWYIPFFNFVPGLNGVWIDERPNDVVINRTSKLHGHRFYFHLDRRKMKKGDEAFLSIILKELDLNLENVRVLEKLHRQNKRMKDIIAKQTKKIRKQSKQAVRMAADRQTTLRSLMHDLKTPLSGIIAATDILLEDIPFPKKYKKMLLQSKFQALHMMQMMHLATRLDTSQKVRLLANDFAYYMEKQIRIFEHSARSYQFQFQYEVKEHKGVVYVDLIFISQIITNLLFNAIRYGKSFLWFQVTMDSSSIIFLLQNDILDNLNSRKAWQEQTKQDSYLKYYLSTGIGLRLLRKRIKRLGGTFTFMLSDEHIAKTTVQLPLTYLVEEKTDPIFLDATPFFGLAEMLEIEAEINRLNKN
ncbi:MAG: hypothetical protein D6767_08770 [Candidatus Hydrogenedentota bacterium]|nr:MAG: hypothetical protein D6767_08770 [Candidatus Hydrogenedentota bacterium]